MMRWLTAIGHTHIRYQAPSSGFQPLGKHIGCNGGRTVEALEYRLTFVAQEPPHLRVCCTQHSTASPSCICSVVAPRNLTCRCSSIVFTERSDSTSSQDQTDTRSTDVKQCHYTDLLSPHFPSAAPTRAIAWKPNSRPQLRPASTASNASTKTWNGAPDP